MEIDSDLEEVNNMIGNIDEVRESSDLDIEDSHSNQVTSKIGAIGECGRPEGGKDLKS